MRAIRFLSIILSIITAISIAYAQTTIQISATVTILESGKTAPVGGYLLPVMKMTMLAPFLVLTAIFGILLMTYFLKR